MYKYTFNCIVINCIIPFKLFFLNVLQCIHFDIIIKYIVDNLTAAEFTDVAKVRRSINQTAGHMAGGCPCHSPGKEVEEAQQQCQGSAARWGMKAPVLLCVADSKCGSREVVGPIPVGMGDLTWIYTPGRSLQRFSLYPQWREHKLMSFLL